MLFINSTAPISLFFFPLGLLFSWFLGSISYSVQICYLNSNLLLDSFSFWLIYVTILVLFFSSLVFQTSFYSFYLAVAALGVCSWVVFCSSNLFWVYLFFEFSLIPIIYIIMKWGSYPDRFVSSGIILLYTTLFSFPLIIVLFFFCPFGSLLVSNASGGFGETSFWGILVVFFSFCAKLPLYGVHHWLPIAHVEAPTSGSMILAGVLLKLGGCGLIRFSQVLSLTTLRGSLLSYIFCSVILVSLISLSQSDFKRLIAYSSVVHMSILVLGVLAAGSSSYMGILLIIVLHGFSSPIIFLLVGLVYNLTGTRLLALLRGLLMFSPLLSFFGVLSFVSNIPTPPFSSFTAEIVLFLGFSYLSLISFLFIFLHGILSVFFNTYWLSSCLFGSPMAGFRNSYSFSVGEILCFSVFSGNLLALTFFIYLF